MLGIESSCDDTGAAVVRGDGTVLGEVLASQAGVHEAWGGVVPKLAQEAHAAAIDSTVEQVSFFFSMSMHPDTATPPDSIHMCDSARRLRRRVSGRTSSAQWLSRWGQAWHCASW